jgi:1-acyl-sn-glycerol-3-phosphate acyltransferase
MDLRLLWYGVCLQVVRVLLTLFFRIRVTHRERLPARGGVLVVSNHQSYLDPILVATGTQRPLHPMARESLFRFLPFALLIRSLYAFPVRRASADLGAVREAMRRLKDGAVVLMFPEGTRTRDGSISPFRAGPIAIAGRAGVPVVPAVIEGAFEAWPRTCWLPRPHTIRVAFGRPLSAEEVAAGDPETLIKILWHRMQDLQAELRRLPRDGV